MPKKVIKRPYKGRHSKAVREQAIADYAVHGSIQAVSNTYEDVPYDTLRSWINSADGQELITTLHDEKTTELRQKYTEVCEMAIDQTKAKLPEATAAQSAVISGVFFDKCRLIDNAPTTISSRTESMETMAERFRAIADQLKHAIPVNLIDVTPEDKG